MARAQKLDEEVKLAVLNLPVAKKDKLLLQLLKKDPLLVKKLVFELLEDGQTADGRAANIRSEIEKRISTHSKGMTPGWLLMDLRSANPLITEHVKVTKDKLGEVTLTVFMLNLAFDRQSEMLQKMMHRMDTFAPYVVRRMAFVFQKAEKLHEDLHLEFRGELNRLLAQIANFPPVKNLMEAEYLPRQF